MNFEINPLLYFTSEDEMADGLEKVAGEDFGSSEAQIVHALDDLAEALGTDAVSYTHLTLPTKLEV